MKKQYILLLSLLILLPLSVSAQSISNPVSGSVFNRGDSIIVTGSIVTQNDYPSAQVEFSAFSSNEGQTIPITTKLYTFTAGVPVSFAQIIQETLEWNIPTDVSTAGDWRILVSVTDVDGDSISDITSDEFKITDNLNLEFTVSQTTLNLGESLDVSGKYLSVIMIVLGLGIFLYIVSLIAQFLVEGRMRDILGSIRGELLKVRREKDHTIVCGYGKVGKNVCETLKEKGERYVIIDVNPEITTKLLQDKEAVIQGDALYEEVLKKANIENARALAACLGSDADNLYLVMGAKELNKGLILAAEAHDELAIKRLHDVGTQVVVYPEVVGGRQMAEALTKVEEAQDLATVATPEKPGDKKSD